jgi:hypothetical protein
MSTGSLLLRDQLAAHPDSEWVFPGPGGQPYDRSYVGRVFRRATRAAGLRDFLRAAAEAVSGAPSPPMRAGLGAHNGQAPGQAPRNPASRQAPPSPLQG